MLANAGSNIGSSIGGGLNKLGTNVGGMLQARADAKNVESQQAEIQKELQQNANDPAQLNALGQKYQSMGKADVAKAFYEAAKQATAKKANQVAALETGGQEIQKEAQLKRAIQVATQKGDQNSLVALRARALDPVEYLKGTMAPKETKILSAGSKLVDNEGKTLAEAPFAPKEPKAGKAVQTVKRDDGSVAVLDGDTGDLISTLPPTGKGEQAKQDASLQLIAQTTSFIKDVDGLMGPGWSESGFIGGVSQVVPGTPAYDREKELLSIRARLGFEQINEMKRLAAESGASGTGLGQISNIEFMSLQSTIDAIYVGMSGEAQDKALTAIKQHLTVVQKLASGVAPAEAIDWSKPEYKAVGYHKDPETGSVFYAPEGPNGQVYKLVDGKFTKVGV